MKQRDSLALEMQSSTALKKVSPTLESFNYTQNLAILQSEVHIRQKKNCRKGARTVVVSNINMLPDKLVMAGIFKTPTPP